MKGLQSCLVVGLLVLAGQGMNVLGAEMTENFEGAFPPAGWTMETSDSACGVVAGTGHDGSGGDLGGSCKLIDFGPGRADAYSPVYDATGLTGVGYDFIYREQACSVWFSFDMASGADASGPYLNWDDGYVLYLNSDATAWNYVTLNWGADFLHYNPNAWQRVQLIKDGDTMAKLQITDMVTGATQVSDHFTLSSLVTNDQMRWMTNNSNGNDRLLYDFDNVYTQHAAAPVPGDANGDGKVNVVDLGILATNYGRSDLNPPPYWTFGDFNGDGNVNVVDLGILATNYGYGMGSSAAVPEPMSLGLVGLGALGLIRRRR